MQNWYNVETFQQNKIIRLNDSTSQQSCYFEIHSKNFIFKQFDKGTQEERQMYDINPEMIKYYSKRKFLFSKFQEGIQLDTQSWFSVIPQRVSLYLKKRFLNDGYQTIFQPFCGVGGVAVHLCDSFKEYIVNDLDRNKIKMLKNNLQVYGKNPDNFRGYCQDFLKVQPYDVSMLIVCPPWGGVNISAYSFQDLDSIMKPTLTNILTHCLKFSSNFVLQMPKNTNLENLIKIINKCKVNPVFTIEKILTNGRISQLFIYFGQEKFTHVSTSALYQQIYTDLELIDRADKMKARQNFRLNPQIVMKQIYSMHNKMMNVNQNNQMEINENQQIV